MEKFETDKVVEQLAHVISDRIMSDQELCDWCHRQANESAGTKFWTIEEREQNENTPQYNLYWSEYTRYQAIVVYRVLGQILNA